MARTFTESSDESNTPHCVRTWRMRGRVVSVEIDPLLQSGAKLRVEPLIYTLLVDAGLSDAHPVEQGLADHAFGAILLYENLFDADRERLPIEAPSLPKHQLELVAENYVLRAHVPGPFLGGLFVYVPRSETAIKDVQLRRGDIAASGQTLMAGRRGTP